MRMRQQSRFIVGNQRSHLALSLLIEIKYFVVVYHGISNESHMCKKIQGTHGILNVIPREIVA